MNLIFSADSNNIIQLFNFLSKITIKLRDAGPISILTSDYRKFIANHMRKQTISSYLCQARYATKNTQEPIWKS